jgi:hypothetical protein
VQGCGLVRVNFWHVVMDATSTHFCVSQRCAPVSQMGDLWCLRFGRGRESDRLDAGVQRGRRVAV